MQLITLQAITPKDTSFLVKLYGKTREKELAHTGWSQEQKTQFIRMQYDAQHAHYSTHFGKASFDLIYDNTTAIGRFYVCRNGNDIRIIDITLLPEYRGAGIGTHLLKAVINEAEQQYKEVSLHCEKTNTALQWYYKLGFNIEEKKDFHYLMKTTLHKEALAIP